MVQTLWQQIPIDIILDIIEQDTGLSIFVIHVYYQLWMRDSGLELFRDMFN